MRTGRNLSRGTLIAGMLIYAASVPVFGAGRSEKSDSTVSKISRITINGQVYEIAGDADIHVNGEEVTIKTNAGDMVINSGNTSGADRKTDTWIRHGGENSGQSFVILDSNKAQEAAQRETQKVREAAQREAQKSREIAQREAQKAREMAQREAQKAREAAQREAQKAREAAQREAQKAREMAQRETQRAKGQSNTVSASVTKQPWHDNATLNRTEALNRDVTRLVSNIGADVHYTHSGQPGVNISGPQASVSAIEVIREGKTVKLSYNSKLYNQHEGLTITVSGIDLSSVTLSGAGDFTADNLTGTNVEIKSLGAGDVKIKTVDASVFRTFCSGAGDITIGTIHSPNTSLNISGAGDIKIETVNSDIFRTQLSGAGNLNIDRIPATTIEANVSGAGDMTLKQINANSVKAYLSGVGNITLSGITTSASLFCSGVGTIQAKGLKASRLSKSVSDTGGINL